MQAKSNTELVISEKTSDDGGDITEASELRTDKTTGREGDEDEVTNHVPHDITVNQSQLLTDVNHMFQLDGDNDEIIKIH